MIVQVPTVKKVSAPPVVMLHTPEVEDVNTGVKPGASVVAVSVGVVPKFCAPGLAKVMTWEPLGVTALDAAEAVLVPTPLVAVTVNV